MRSKRVLRRRTSGVSPVIGEVLLVAITVVVSITVWLVVSRTIDQPDEEKVVVKLSTPMVKKYVRDNTTVWDATMDIYTLTLRDETIKWIEVCVFVTSVNGSVLQNLTTMSDDMTGTYDGTSPIDVELWYVELDPGDPKMTAGDSIKVTGMDRSWEGSTLKMMHLGELIGSIEMPTDFP
jgi:hypothetical protein